MGACYIHICDNCGYTVHTSGPWEFCRENGEERKACGRPGSADEMPEQGFSGLSGEFYCPTCDKVRDLIITELKEPTNDKMSVWLGKAEPKDEYKQEGAVKCPVCKNTELILAPERNGAPEVTCPRCKVGHLIGSKEFLGVL